MVTRVFYYKILLEKQADGFHIATKAPHESYSHIVNNVYETVTDYSNAPGDNLAQLGDITNDLFHARDFDGRAPYPVATLPYVGSMAKPTDGFVYKDSATPGKGYYFLLTNRVRFTRKSMHGALLDVQNKPFVLGRSAAASAAEQHNIAPLCFGEGTRVATTAGERPVEALAPGDVVITASGNRRPIKWIGRRRMTGMREGGNDAPVRVSAGAFGNGLPRRDLRLSPGHPVLVGADADNEGGHLVPIMCLVNGTSVHRTTTDTITYWHVELDAHDILLAEGLPAESYVDLGSRSWFAGTADASGDLGADPDLALPGAPGRCRPVAIDGPVVEAERRRLDMVFAMRLEAACAWPLEAAALAD